MPYIPCNMSQLWQSWALCMRADGHSHSLHPPLISQPPLPTNNTPSTANTVFMEPTAYPQTY